MIVDSFKETGSVLKKRKQRTSLWAQNTKINILAAFLEFLKFHSFD